MAKLGPKSKGKGPGKGKKEETSQGSEVREPGGQEPSSVEGMVTGQRSQRARSQRSKIQRSKS